jgi:DHA2 family multidrug resistance protein
VLDKGQEDDWFQSPTIVLFAAVSVAAIVFFVVWEWRQKHPVVEVKLFKSLNFTATSAMMGVLGIALYGSTVLLPQYMQIWMGYSAQDAGMALSPGGFAVIAMLPLVGFLVSRVDARWLIALGFVLLSASLFHMAHTLYPGIDFKTAVLIRVYQSIGLAFLFVPINTVMYNGVDPSKNNQVSGIVNLFRNLGGSIGIAFVATEVARRSQLHQARLAAHVAPSPALTARLAGIAQALQHAGIGAAQAAKMATGAVYGELIKQSQTLAYLDVLYMMGVFTAIMVPAVFLTRRVKPGAAAMAH